MREHARSFSKSLATCSAMSRARPSVSLWSSFGLSSLCRSCSVVATARVSLFLFRPSASSSWESLSPVAALALSDALHPPKSLDTSAVPSFILRILRGERDLLEICCSSVTRAKQTFSEKSPHSKIKNPCDRPGHLLLAQEQTEVPLGPAGARSRTPLLEASLRPRSTPRPIRAARAKFAVCPVKPSYAGSQKDHRS